MMLLTMNDVPAAIPLFFRLAPEFISPFERGKRAQRVKGDDSFPSNAPRWMEADALRPLKYA
jgi:hypothetical protein